MQLNIQAFFFVFCFRAHAFALFYGEIIGWLYSLATQHNLHLNKVEHVMGGVWAAQMFLAALNHLIITSRHWNKYDEMKTQKEYF